MWACGSDAHSLQSLSEPRRIEIYPRDCHYAIPTSLMRVDKSASPPGDGQAEANVNENLECDGKPGVLGRAKHTRLPCSGQGRKL